MIDDRNGDMMILKNVPNERLKFLQRATAKTKNSYSNKDFYFSVLNRPTNHKNTYRSVK